MICPNSLYLSFLFPFSFHLFFSFSIPFLFLFLCRLGKPKRSNGIEVGLVTEISNRIAMEFGNNDITSGCIY